MVTGQFGVGKTSLVMILVGDKAPDEAQSTDGISLLEGRCGLDIDNRDWILITNLQEIIKTTYLITYFST
jgi:GTPase SAR1 family protein